MKYSKFKVKDGWVWADFKILFFLGLFTCLSKLYLINVLWFYYMMFVDIFILRFWSRNMELLLI